MQKVAKEILLECFREILRIRLIEEKIVEKYSEQKMRCPVHFSIGQEAAAVAVCKNLLKTDYLISNHRAHAHYLAKGGSLKRMIAELYGKKDGCSFGKGGSMHLIDLSVNIIGTTPIVGGSLPVGVGVAFASFLKEEGRITAIFFGEAATEEGVWAESINFASLKNLPILFVCENNLYSCYSPLSVRQSSQRSRLNIAKSHGIATFHGQGNDIREAYKVARQAVEKVRETKKPVFIELDTYRYLEHCGPFFDPKGFRPEAEEQTWFEKCPLKLSEHFLRKEKILTDSLFDSYKNEIQQEIEKSFAFAEQSSFPTYNPHEHIYA